MRHASIRTRFPPETQPPLKFEVIFCVRGVLSPILANLYLHYVLDLWVKAWRKKEARGEMILVRYADDGVLGFQYRKTQNGSGSSCGNVWGNSGWNYIRRRRA